MTPREIQNGLAEVGMTQQAIARRAKVSQAAVSRVIRGDTTSHDIRMVIATILQKHVNEIWPGHLQADGYPIRRGRPAKRTNMLQEAA